MEQMTQIEPAASGSIDLFAESAGGGPSLEQLRSLADHVQSSERNLLAFDEQLQQKLAGSSARSGQLVLGVGIGLCILGRYDQAVEKLQKAKDCKEKFVYLGYALRQLGRFNEVIDSFDKSLSHGAEVLSTNLEKAATCRQAGDFEGAHKHLKGCANFQNVSAEYHYQLGRLLEDQGLYDQAVDNYCVALELLPDHQGALFRLAYRANLSGDDEAAIDYYKQLVAGGSTGLVRVNSLLNLAVLYEDTGDFDKASECVEAVLQAHPNHPRATLFKKDIDSSKTMFYDEEKEKKKTRKNQILETPISDFELSVRSRNCLKKMKIDTLGDLLRTTEVDLLSYKNFGETSLKEIKAILDVKGLRLGQAIEDAQLASGQGAPAAGFETVSAPAKDEGILNKPVADLQLSVRSRKCLQKLNIRTIGELTQKTDAELLGCKNFGVTSLNEIKRALTNLGLSLRTLD